MVAVLMIISVAVVTAQEEYAGLSLAGGRFGEINLKAGLDFESTVRGKLDSRVDMGGGPQDYLVNEMQPSDIGLNLGVEYLSPLLFRIFKGGIGIQYAFPRTSWALPEPDYMSGETESSRATFSFLPIYAALQLHPSESVKELYLRGNIGYALCLTHAEEPEKIGVTKKATSGGLYWGVAAGFEFNWGLIFECSYSQNYWTVAVDDTGGPDFDLALSYSKIGVAIGYKIKL